MSQTLSLNNYDEPNIIDHVGLINDVAAGATVLPVENTEDFGNSTFALIGTPGSPQAEIVQINTAIDSLNLQLAMPTELLHNRYTNVCPLFGDSLRIYRASNVDGTVPSTSMFQAGLLATVAIDADDDATIYTDVNGGSAFWYKYTYYNSLTQAESDIARARPVRGTTGGYVNYCSLDEIRGEAGFTGASYITAPVIDEKRQSAQSEIDSTLSSYYTVPFTPPISPLLSDICKRLAAGLLLQKEYSHVNNPDTNGTNKLTEARADLQKLIHPELSGTPLLDGSGKSIALPNPNTSASSWANNDTATTDPAFGGAPRYFRMGMVDGYRSRDF